MLDTAIKVMGGAGGRLSGLVPMLGQQALELEPVSEPAIARWKVLALGVLLALVVIFPSFKSSKRSHQD